MLFAKVANHGWLLRISNLWELIEYVVNWDKTAREAFADRKTRSPSGKWQGRGGPVGDGRRLPGHLGVDLPARSRRPPGHLGDGRGIGAS
jgi:hypothetical protein